VATSGENRDNIITLISLLNFLTQNGSPGATIQFISFSDKVRDGFVWRTIKEKLIPVLVKEGFKT
jgi:hypothetical protein